MGGSKNGNAVGKNHIEQETGTIGGSFVRRWFFEVAKQKGIEYNGNLHRGSRVLREGQPEMQAGDKANQTEKMHAGDKANKIEKMQAGNIGQEKRPDTLGTVLCAGKILLSSGAEIYRAEETMYRMAEAMHIEEMDAYVMNRGIFATAKVGGEGIQTRIVSVPDKEIDIGKIEEVNELSRDVCTHSQTLDYLSSSLKKIESRNHYGVMGRMLAYFLGAGGFSFAIGTSMRDSLCAGIVGSMIGLYLLFSQGRIKSRVLETILGSVLTAILGNLLVSLGIGVHLSYIIIGVMMDLVPGVAFVNSVREFSQNNFATGETLLISALLTCVSMASGVVLVEMNVPEIKLISTAISNISRISYLVLVIRSIVAGLGTVGFAIMFHVKRRHYLVCGVLGAISWFVYVFVLKWRYSEVIAVFISGFLAVLASRVLAVYRRCPQTVFLVTSLIPLLPGISLYRAVYYLFRGNMAGFMHFGKICSFTAFTIAISIAMVQQLPRSWSLPGRRWRKTDVENQQLDSEGR